ncbi:c-type cytochrome [Candidatus Sumerlaeota bacterium]|nr:c-type cytochrome [Candidatus Sumerlaeota bacterium]
MMGLWTPKTNWIFAASRICALAAMTAAVWGAESGDSGGAAKPGQEKKESVPQDAEAARKQTEARRRTMRPAAELKLGEKKIVVSYAATSAESPAFKQVESCKEGSVIEFTDGQAIKLKTEIGLKFGGAVIRAGNIAPGYPGVYSLWIKKTAAGWSLVFNEKADVFGTQHNPKADVAEVPLRFETKDHEPKFKAELAAGDGGKNTLAFAWGTNRWIAEFAPAAEASGGSESKTPEKEAKPAADARPADPKSLKNPIALTAASVAEGKAIYLRNCQRCHGVDGRALENIDFEATNLTKPDVWVHGTSDGEIFASTKFGAGADMPPFAGKLSDEEIWKIVNHIRSLWPKAAAPESASQ